MCCSLLIQNAVDSLDVLHLPGVGRHPAAVVHDQQDRRGGDHHQPLPVCPRQLPRPVHTQLDLPLLLRGIPGPDCRDRRMCPDCPLL